ncbi:MAG: biopolymer transporter ExbD [Myxococcota bacterium]
MAEEKKASAATVKRIIKRNRAKHAHGEHHGINIYPMMDMMTILLVFMVMQFANSSAAAITQSEELQIPYSTSEEDMEEFVMVQISRSGITVDGEEVLSLRDGLVGANEKQGGGTGFLITKLYRKMGDVRDFKKRVASQFPDQVFEGNVMIIADARTPFRTLSEVIYTLGQTEFSNLRFVSNKTDELGRSD